MAYTVPTVAIRKANGKRSVIAKANFNPKAMRLWSDPVPAADDKDKGADDKSKAADDKAKGGGK